MLVYDSLGTHGLSWAQYQPISLSWDMVSHMILKACCITYISKMSVTVIAVGNAARNFHVPQTNIAYIIALDW